MGDSVKEGEDFHTCLDKRSS